MRLATHISLAAAELQLPACHASWRKDTMGLMYSTTAGEAQIAPDMDSV